MRRCRCVRGPHGLVPSCRCVRGPREVRARWRCARLGGSARCGPARRDFAWPTHRAGAVAHRRKLHHSRRSKTSVAFCHSAVPGLCRCGSRIRNVRASATLKPPAISGSLRRVSSEVFRGFLGSCRSERRSGRVSPYRERSEPGSLTDKAVVQHGRDSMKVFSGDVLGRAAEKSQPPQGPLRAQAE